MIDWLELLWKAAEEGQEFDLPGEPDLPSLRPGDLNREEEEAEEEAAPWKNLRSIPAEADGTVRTTAWKAESPLSGSAAVGLLRNAAGSALTALYRQVRETVFPGRSGVPGHGSTVVVREEAPAAPGVTEAELDRSLRRDSRRYDGGMSIY